MTTSNDPDEIRAEIENTRAALSNDVDALTDTANPEEDCAPSGRQGQRRCRRGEGPGHGYRR